ncbi:MAG: DNA cytosine methyltransferase, partial [Bacteroidales bacterium]|nr:DNA cytosine methyltransferase [Bacteroidales bacterium]
MALNAISLFSSSGIGDLGLKANGISTVIACELLSDRMKLFRNNHPKTTCFNGDIWSLKSQIIEYYKSTFNEPPFVILATPPCQGMSSNGMG